MSAEPRDAPARNTSTRAASVRAARRGIHVTLPVAFVAMAALSCAPAPDDAPGASDTVATADDVLRTADPYARGYTDDDFPRVQELAPGVYSIRAASLRGRRALHHGEHVRGDRRGRSRR